MKLLFVVTEDWYFHSHRLALAVAAKERGCDVVVVTRVTNHKGRIESQGVRVIPAQWLIRSSLNPFLELNALIELCFIFFRERPDIIHNVAIKPTIYGNLAGLLARVPRRVSALGGLGFIFTSQKFHVKILRKLIVTTFRCLLNRKNSFVIVQNEDDLSVMLDECGLDSSRLRLIRGAGVDLNVYNPSPIPQAEPVVMLASRMIWDKGIREFVESARLLKAKGIKARFVLVGSPDGENPASVPENELLRWNTEGIVEWWGYREDMPQTLAEASIVCLPTYYGEGVPKVLIEAMACARPIITTDTAGCRDLVEDAENGILVAPRDVHSLAAAISALLIDGKKCEQMGKMGRQIAADKYSISKVIDGVFSIYNLESSKRTEGNSKEL